MHTQLSIPQMVQLKFCFFFIIFINFLTLFWYSFYFQSSDYVVSKPCSSSQEKHDVSFVLAFLSWNYDRIEVREAEGEALWSIILIWILTLSSW